LKYLVPIKFYETSLEDGFKEEVIWSVVETDDTESSDEELFDIPEDVVMNNGSANDYYENDENTSSTRELLLYGVDYIDTEDKGFDNMNQIFYYSDVSYEMLVAYFETLLAGTEGYSVFVSEKMTAIDGTLNGDTIIIIVNNYKEYEPEVGKNGVNINYY
jgi:hypothetical protein